MKEDFIKEGFEIGFGQEGYSRCETLLKSVQKLNKDLKDLRLYLTLSPEEWEQLSAQEWYADIKKRLYGEAAEVVPYYADGKPYQVEVILRFAR